MALNRTVAMVADPVMGNRCTPQNMLRAMTDFLNLDERRGSCLLPFKMRKTLFEATLRKWEKTDGLKSIQETLTDTNVLNAALRGGEQIKGSVKAPPWVCMDVLKPYLLLGADEELLVPIQNFKIAADLLDTKENHGRAIRNFIVNLQSSQLKPKDANKIVLQFVKFLSSLSQTQGNEAVQDALFNVNKDGKTAFDFLFMGGENGYHFERVTTLFFLLHAFKLDVDRFNRTHKQSLDFCMLVLFAVQSYALMASVKDGEKFSSLATHFSSPLFGDLNDLMRWSYPSLLSPVTQKNVTDDEVSYMGSMSGKVFNERKEPWFRLSTPENRTSVAIEPASFFVGLAKDTPFATHPYTRETLLWNGNDLWHMDIKTVLDPVSGVVIVNEDPFGLGCKPVIVDRVPQLTDFLRTSLGATHEMILTFLSQIMVNGGEVAYFMSSSGVIQQYEPIMSEITWYRGFSLFTYNTTTGDEIRMRCPLSLKITSEGFRIDMNGKGFFSINNGMDIKSDESSEAKMLGSFRRIVFMELL